MNQVFLYVSMVAGCGVMNLCGMDDDNGFQPKSFYDLRSRLVNRSNNRPDFFDNVRQFSPIDEYDDSQVLQYNFPPRNRAHGDDWSSAKSTPTSSGKSDKMSPCSTGKSQKSYNSLELSPGISFGSLNVHDRSHDNPVAMRLIFDEEPVAVLNTSLGIVSQVNKRRLSPEIVKIEENLTESPTRKKVKIGSKK